jgi:hypothetical protein
MLALSQDVVLIMRGHIELSFACTGPLANSNAPSLADTQQDATLRYGRSKIYSENKSLRTRRYGG